MVDRRVSKAVVVGVDGTPEGLEAVAWAAREARLRGQRVRIVHACTSHDPSRLDRAYEMLDDAVRRARDISPSVEVLTDLEADDPVLLLERVARTASVLVLGRPGPGGVTRQMVDAVGHPTTGLVAPLVVVPGSATTVGASGHVAVLVESSAGGTMVTAAATAAAARSDRCLRAIRVPPPGEDFAESVATLDLLVSRACVAYPHVDVKTEVQLGPPLSVLAEVSSESALVVVSGLAFDGTSRSLRSMHRSLLGWARCPVMVLPVRLPHGTADPRSQRTAV